MENSKPLNTVLIGLGMVADTHLQAIADLQDKVYLRGVYARTVDTARTFALKAESCCGYTPETYLSLDAIAADSDIDFVIIATPPNARVEIVRVMAAANIHILMEKPIERTSDAAVEIVELCETQGILCGVVFQHRVRAASIKLGELVRSDTFGRLGMVNVVVPWWREQTYYDEPGRGTYNRDGGGVLISQAIHTLDLMQSLTGDVSEVQAICRTTRFHQMESEDFVTAGLAFSNGAVGSVVATTADFPGDAESITLHFDKAVAVLNRGRLVVNWRDGRSDQYGEDAQTGSGADPMAFTSDWHRDVIGNFADAVNTGNQPVVNGREALKVHRLIDAIVQSSKLRHAVVPEY